MTDVYERLRADNPVKNGKAPRFDDVLARVEEGSDEHPPRARRVPIIAWGAIALVVPVVVVVVALTTLGHRPASVGSGGRVSPNLLVHYQLRSVYMPANESGAGLSYQVVLSDVSVSGSSVHVITTHWIYGPRGLHRETRLRETLTSRGRLNIFVAAPNNPHGELTEGPARHGGVACGLFFNPVALRNVGEFCGEGFRDPAGTLRDLYRTRALILVDRNFELGRRIVNVFRLPYPGWDVRVFVDPATFVPVQVTATSHTSTGGYQRGTIRATITDYERQPLTAADSKLLQMGPHPGAARR